MAVDDIYTVSLLHMNGADGSTSITDESGKTWTLNGNAQLDTAKKKFGTASLYFDGSGDYAVSSTHDDFDYGAADWTWNLQFATNRTTRMDVMVNDVTWPNSAGLTLILNYSGQGSIAFYEFSTNKISTTTDQGFTDNNFHHLELARGSDIFYLFLDGSLIGSSTASQSNGGGYPTVLGINENLSSYPYLGWIDEVRISKGIARHTSTFEPPTAEYGAEEEQVIISGVGISASGMIYMSLLEKYEKIFGRKYKKKKGLIQPDLLPEIIPI